MSKLALQLIAQAKKENWKSLDLGRTGLREIPEEVFELTELEELWLSDAVWNWEKKEWTYSRNRGEINLIWRLSEGIKRLKKLKKLYAGGFQHVLGISDISILKNLSNLQSLNLKRTSVSDISPLRNLKNLKSLDLSSTNISDISPLRELEQLQLLDLLWNEQIQNFSPLRELKQLQFLFLRGTNISNISLLTKLTQLESLDLDRTSVSEITPLANLKQLRSLEIGGTSISDIAPLVDLKQLRSLDLQETNISDITPLKNLKQLQSLNLSRNKQIKDFFPLIELKQLQSLNLSSTNINDILILKELPKLQSLDLSYNDIRDLSPLRHLIKKGVPVTFEDYEEHGIRLYNCPITTPPKEIVEQGNEAILRYFEELKRSKKEKLVDYLNDEVKVVLAGNSTAGKTSLINYLLEKEATEHASTHWLETHQWKYKRPVKKGDITIKELNIRVFDFGGQEYYHDTHHLFFSKNTAYLLLWDNEMNCYGTSQTTLINPDTKKKVKVDLEHFPVEYWVDCIRHFTFRESRRDMIRAFNRNQLGRFSSRKKKRRKRSVFAKQRTPIPGFYHDSYGLTAQIDDLENYSSVAPILLVQNKIDRDGIVHLNNQGIKEKFDQVYDFTSISVEKAKRLQSFKNIFHEMLEQMETVGATLPGHWKFLKEAFDDYKGDKPILSMQEFTTYCNKVLGKNNVTLRIDQYTASVICGYLKGIGSLLWFKKWDELTDTIFVKTDWIVKAIYKIFLPLTDSKKQGKLDKKHIKKQLSESSDGEIKSIIQLMSRFKIIFELPDEKDTYIAPQYLPPSPSQSMSMIIDSFDYTICRFSFEGFIHKSIVLDFFSQYGKKVFKEKEGGSRRFRYYFWRNGIVLKDFTEQEFNNLMLVQFINADKVKNKIGSYIEIKSLRRDSTDFSKEIIKTLEDMTQGWQVEKKVTVNGIDFIPLEDLKEFARKALYTFKYNGKVFRLFDFKAHLPNIRIPQKVFISYSSKDMEYKNELLVRLNLLQRRGYLESWHDRMIIPGEEWDGKIKAELKSADIIILLVSPDFLNSDYIWDVEIETAMEHHEDRKATVIPIPIRSSDTEGLPFAKIRSPISIDKPVSLFEDKDEAWLKVTEGIKKVINQKLNQ